MKTIAVHNKEYLDKNGYIEVWEVIDDLIMKHYVNDIEYVGLDVKRAIFNCNANDGVANPIMFIDLLYLVNQKIKAYTPHKNKLINWFRKLTGTKVKVVGIDSKRKEAAYTEKVKGGGVKLPDHLIYIQSKTPDYAHCIIYKLEKI